VRELRNAIERAMILEESTYITPASLPIAITRPDGHPAAPRAEIPTEGLSLEDNERMLLARRWKKPAAIRPRRRGCCALPGTRCGTR
jgi:DNA-binding NtrC family response regulator